MRKSSLCLIFVSCRNSKVNKQACHLASFTEGRTSNAPCGGSDFISETMGASRGNIVTQKTWVAIALQLCFYQVSYSQDGQDSMTRARVARSNGKTDGASRTRMQVSGLRRPLHRFQRLGRTPWVPCNANRRPLTILRKQIKLFKVPPLPFPIKGEEGWGVKNFTSQEDKFIESPGHWRHRIYRQPFDGSAYSKRCASPLSPSQNQRFEVAERSSHRIRSWRL